MNPSRLLSIACWFLVGLFVASFISASQEMSLWAGLKDVARTRWGVVTLVDLYAGLFVLLAWIVALAHRDGLRGQRLALHAIGWGVALMLTGNFATIIFLGARSWRRTSLLDVFTATPPATRPH